MSVWGILAINGLLTGALALSAYAGYAIGRRSRQSQASQPKQPQLTAEEQRKIKEFNDNFANLMSYDITKALAPRKRGVADGE